MPKLTAAAAPTFCTCMVQTETLSVTTAIFPESAQQQLMASCTMISSSTAFCFWLADYCRRTSAAMPCHARCVIRPPILAIGARALLCLSPLP